MTSTNVRRRRDQQAAEASKHDAVCESCDRPLFTGIDRWEEQPAQDADGVTTFTICEDCADAVEVEA